MGWVCSLVLLIFVLYLVRRVDKLWNENIDLRGQLIVADIAIKAMNGSLTKK